MGEPKAMETSQQMKKAVCPNNPRHREFITVAHVAEDWKVDEHGNFLAVLEQMETIANPDPGNIWTCSVCSAEAVFA